MQGFEKYYRKTWHERLEILNKHTISDEQVKILKDGAKNPELGETMIENFLKGWHLIWSSTESNIWFRWQPRSLP